MRFNFFFWLGFQIRSKSRNYSFARWEGKSLPFSRIFISSITGFGCFCSDCCAKYFVSLKANKKEGDNQSAHEFNCLRLFTNFSRGSIQKLLTSHFPATVCTVTFANGLASFVICLFASHHPIHT